jgi:hypothetical protein
MVDFPLLCGINLIFPGFDANATHDAASRWPWGETDAVIDSKLKSHVHFNHFSVADLTAVRYRSLQSVMKKFGHNWVDILKVTKFPVGAQLSQLFLRSISKAPSSPRLRL